MGLKNHIVSDDIHVRQMTIKTYPAKDACVLVEGELLDNRKIDVYTATGDWKPKGILHNMIVRMLVGPPGLTIRDIEVEMPVHPIPECPEVIPRFETLKGMRIQAGFTSALKKAIAGRTGCAHITSLLIAMSSAAVQGYYAHIASAPSYESNREKRLRLVSFIADTCHVWRTGGPHLTRTIERINADSEPGDHLRLE